MTIEAGPLLATLVDLPNGMMPRPEAGAAILPLALFLAGFLLVYLLTLRFE